ncbi:hypothetical protein [Pedococcus sp. 5OH_020]|jgi:hypothetical protein|uniref:hypothetical protein n=1 Tax=Pedococcus sp. 5OH_020 TaxID=2989814 RepID=UPI0022E9EB0E|nr:hypothetical protein [Pedococcus sp. 5OH_020]
MTVTTTRLTQAAAVATAVAGTIFVLVQINHPPTVLASATTTDWFVRNAAKTVMAVLALVGFTGIYLRQRAKVGVLGLAGYLLLGMGYFMLFGTEFVATIVVPTAAPSAPGYIGDVIAAAFGGKPVGDIGPFMTVFALTAVGYAGGGLLFGIATFRAGILSKSAAALLAVGNVATLSLAVLPSSFNRPMAVPTGIALIGLGVSLWRDQARQQTAAVTTTAAMPQPAAAVR